MKQRKDFDFESSIRCDPNLDMPEVSLDDITQIHCIEKATQRAYSGGDPIVSRNLDEAVEVSIAALFFFEFTKEPERCDGKYECHGRVGCLLPDARDRTRLYEILNRQAKFLISSRGGHQSQVSFAIDADVTFSVKKLSVNLRVSLYRKDTRQSHCICGLPQRVDDLLDHQRALKRGTETTTLMSKPRKRKHDE